MTLARVDTKIILTLDTLTLKVKYKMLVYNIKHSSLKL